MIGYGNLKGGKVTTTDRKKAAFFLLDAKILEKEFVDAIDSQTQNIILLDVACFNLDLSIGDTTYPY